MPRKITLGMSLGLCLIGLVPGSAASGKGAADTSPARQHLSFNMTEFTWLGADLIPDQQSLIAAMMGDIYKIDVRTNRAVRLRGGVPWDMAPRVSPDGKFIAFLSNSSDPPQRLTKSITTEGEPRALWIMDINGANARQLSTEFVESFIWASDSKSLVISVQTGDPFNGKFSRISPRGALLEDLSVVAGAVNFKTTLVGRLRDGSVLALSQDAKPILITSTLDGLAKPSAALPSGLRIHDAIIVQSDQSIVALIQHGRGTKSIARFVAKNFEETPEIIASVPDDARLLSVNRQGVTAYYTAGGLLFELSTVDGDQRKLELTVSFDQNIVAAHDTRYRIPKEEYVRGKYLRWYTTSRNDSMAAFSEFGQIFLRKTRNGKIQQLNVNPTSFEYTPTFSPDSKHIAYTTLDDHENGRLVIATLDSDERKIVSTEPGIYASPAWSEDGNSLAYFFVEKKTASNSAREPDGAVLLKVWDRVNNKTEVVTALNWPDYSQIKSFVAPVFSKSGDRIIIQDWPDNKLISIFSIGIRDKTRRVHATVDPHVDYFMMSPDRRQLALVRRVGFDIVSLPAPLEELNEFDVQTIVPASTRGRFVQAGANYVEWKSDRELRWTFLNDIFEMTVDKDERPRHVSGVDVRFKRQVPTGRLAFTNAKIITLDPNDRVIENGTIIVSGERIETIGDARSIKLEPGLKRIDLGGATIIPGLVSTHAHLFDHPDIWSPNAFGYTSYLQHGVTSILDLHGLSQIDALGRAEMFRADRMLGPRYFSVGRPVMRPQSAYAVGDTLASDETLGWPVPGGFAIDSFADAERVVNELQASGVNMVKSYELSSRTQRQWLEKAARKAGVRTTAHIGNTPVEMLTIIQDGFDAVEHFPLITAQDEPLHGDLASYFAASGRYITPTLMGEGMAYFRKNRPEYLDLGKDSPFLWGTLERSTSYASDFFGSNFKDARYDKDLLAGARFLAQVMRLGGNVCASDHGDVPGFGHHLDMWFYAEGGASLHDVLRSGSLCGARKMGLDRDIGSLQKGMLADFLVLRTDPDVSIQNTLDMQYVVKGGAIYDRDTLTKIYPDYIPMTRPSWFTDVEWQNLRSKIPKPLVFDSAGRTRIKNPE